MIELKNLPWPPSDNRKYLSRSFVKTKEWRAFESDMDAYHWNNLKQIAEAKQHFKSLQRPAIHFFLHSPRWLTKVGKTRRLDASNRMKSAQDAIANMIETDDCNFWHSSATKVTSDREYMDVKILEFLLPL
jgi:Holliday junction resolvase RusA-like endonuclease